MWGMQTPIRLYLDTSVIGGYFDDEWCAPTQELWRQMKAGCFCFVTSQVTMNELANAPAHVRDLFDKNFTQENLLPFNDEAEQLADAFLRHGILPPKYTDDARHVAICTVARIAHLVSWNFRHLVNPERRKGFNAINRLQGYPDVSIVNPWEIIYVDQYPEKI